MFLSGIFVFGWNFVCDVFCWLGWFVLLCYLVIELVLSGDDIKVLVDVKCFGFNVFDCFDLVFNCVFCWLFVELSNR